MEQSPLSIIDLVPRKSSFELSTLPNKTIWLKPWSLRVRTWAIQRYGGPKQLDMIFRTQEIGAVADMAFFMLEDKTIFADVDTFMEAIQTPRDQLKVITAMLGAVGIGEPEIAEINKTFEKPKDEKQEAEPEAPLASSPSIGANSSTS